MKQCPTCHRIYPDDTLTYCLDDGAALYTHTAYDPEATQQMTGARSTSPAQMGGQTFRQPPLNQTPFQMPLPQKSNRGLLYLLLVLLLAGIGIGVFALVRSGGQNDSSQGSSQSSTPQTSPRPRPSESSGSNENKQPPVSQNSNPASSETTPTASWLVGTWQSNFTDHGDKIDITATFNADGTSKVFEKDMHGRTATENRTWQYSDGILHERFQNGVNATASLSWSGRDTFELTTIDNGVPAYTGFKILYHRVKP